MNTLEILRLRLARADALLALSLVGIASGTVTGLVILAFRLFIETAQGIVLPGGGQENYEALSWAWRIILPVAGGLIVGSLVAQGRTGVLPVGVTHVMERLARHEGRLPLSNAVRQFFAAAVAIVAGHSVGREGPSIHLGAASSSLLGQWLALPNNSIRTLVACGTAASIAASFNTPIAGVIFAMEVVMLEYTLAGFAPVIIAAVCATSLTRAVYGADPAFKVPALEMASLWELPFIVGLGVSVGALAGVFVFLVRRISARTSQLPAWLRGTVAGLITGVCALATPEVMGIGYDTVELTLVASLGLGALALIAVFKLLATAACIGLASPGGLIGPTLVIGAAAGGAIGILGHETIPEHSASPGLYALLGMGAMMGASLQAPLAALMAILELTANPNIILPGMLAVVAAVLTSKEIFKQDSVYIVALRTGGIDYRHDPIAMSLSRTGVSAVMDRRFVLACRMISAGDAPSLLKDSPHWIVVMEGELTVAVLPAGELANQLLETGEIARDAELDLLQAAKNPLVTVAIPVHATLREALKMLDHSRADAACVTRLALTTDKQIIGVLTRKAITAMVRGSGRGEISPSL